MRQLRFLILIGISFSACNQDITTETYMENKKNLPPKERYGELFTKAQMAGFYKDGKTVADCIPKYPTAQIIDRYQAMKDDSDFDLELFWKDHFSDPPQYASDFSSEASRSVSAHITLLWDVLTRKPDDQEPGTLITLPKSYIVPGGRFREIYYWDSYFTMLGLVADNRIDLVENMVDNFAYLIDTIGFIPNGNRTYFLTRSQPPFFALMVELLATVQNQSTYAKYLPHLVGEYEFWMDGIDEVDEQNPAVQHVVRLPDGTIMNRFFDQGDYPREEMWKDDIELAESADRPANDLFRDIRSACESGWDFSSRWFADLKHLTTARTTDIIPVDLNALLYQLELTIAKGYQEAGQLEKADAFAIKANDRAKALQQYCWDSETGFFRDYLFQEGTFTPVLSLAGMFPLYVGLANDAQGAQVALVLQDQFLFPGGLISTTIETGQQWDAPNGWAPLHYVAVQGLRQTGQIDLAQDIRNRWVNLNTKVYQNTGKLVEKYNVVDITLESGGGEYPVQDGFGWTNGVLQAFLSE